MRIKTVGVVGCGTMGTGIGQASALAGYETVLVKLTPQAGGIDGAQARVLGQLDKDKKRGRLTAEQRDAAVGRLRFSTGLDSLSGCDLVIESAVEEMEIKTRLLADVERELKR